ncbi:MAG: hypothetical protein KC486_33340, partial [Myxococcales bacterium]|nr:hypothetical protein [Myxococcales bacterium]
MPVFRRPAPWLALALCLGCGDDSSGDTGTLSASASASATSASTSASTDTTTGSTSDDSATSDASSTSSSSSSTSATSDETTASTTGDTTTGAPTTTTSTTGGDADGPPAIFRTPDVAPVCGPTPADPCTPGDLGWLASEYGSTFTRADEAAVSEAGVVYRLIAFVERVGPSNLDVFVVDEEGAPLAGIPVAFYFSTAPDA